MLETSDGPVCVGVLSDFACKLMTVSFVMFLSVCARTRVSAAVLQSVDHLFQNVGASVGDLLQDLISVLLELRPLPLTQR